MPIHPRGQAGALLTRAVTVGYARNGWRVFEAAISNRFLVVIFSSCFFALVLCPSCLCKYLVLFISLSQFGFFPPMENSGPKFPKATNWVGLPSMLINF